MIARKLFIWGLSGFLLTICMGMTEAEAQSDWRDLERVSTIYVSVYDQVDDGCWPKPWATKEAVEAVFRQAKISVAETLDPIGYLSSDLQHQFVISANGWYLTDERDEGLGCAVAVMIKLWRPEVLAEGWEEGENSEKKKWGIVYYGDAHWLLVGPSKTIMQTDITASAVADAEKLANAILKAREE